MCCSIVLHILTLLSIRSPKLHDLAKPKPCIPLNNSQPLTTTLLLLSLWDWLLVSSYKWNHRVFVSLFTLYYVLKVHPCCNRCHNFLFKGWIISLCMRIPIPKWLFGLAIHSLMNVWTASASWLLWIMLLWTSMCNLSGLLNDIYLGVKLSLSPEFNSFISSQVCFVIDIPSSFFHPPRNPH